MVNIIKQARERAETVKVLSKHRIYTVIDIAGYIINTNMDKGIRMRRHRVDMFLYFAQVCSIIRTGEPLFNSSTYVRGIHRPYTEWMDNKYGNKYKIFPMPRVDVYWDRSNGISDLGKRQFNPHITMFDRQMLDDIINTLNTKSNRELQDKIAMQGLTYSALLYHGNEITERMMLEFCENKRS